jgi:hypothetical protein
MMGLLMHLRHAQRGQRPGITGLLCDSSNTKKKKKQSLCEIDPTTEFAPGEST